MSRLKLKQVISNLQYNEATEQLIFSSSRTTSNDTPDFIFSGSIEIAQSLYTSGTLTVKGVDNFGDSGSFYSLDLGDY